MRVAGLLQLQLVAIRERKKDHEVSTWTEKCLVASLGVKMCAFACCLTVEIGINVVSCVDVHSALLRNFHNFVEHGGNTEERR